MQKNIPVHVFPFFCVCDVVYVLYLERLGLNKALATERELVDDGLVVVLLLATSEKK
jgi:hypothetical protein